VRDKVNEALPGLGDQIEAPVRLGRFSIGQRPRMLRVTAKTENAKKEIMKNASKIKQTASENRNKIWFNDDLTEKERMEGKKLREELKQRKEAGEKDIAIRRGKIVKLKERLEDGEQASKYSH